MSLFRPDSYDLIVMPCMEGVETAENSKRIGEANRGPENLRLCRHD